MKVLLVLSLLFLMIACVEEEEESPLEDTNRSSSNDSVNTVKLSAPTGLSVTYEYDFDSTPAVTISGVKSGQTVRLFTDSNCSTQIASDTATSETINLVVDSPLSSGSYLFYANTSENSATSSCSTEYVSFELEECPEGYAKIPGNTEHDVKPFCVMKFEAKNVAGVATSQASTRPWINISANDAKAACVSLNDSGYKYNLISNAEWMAMANHLVDQSYNNYSEINASITKFPYGNSNSLYPPPTAAAQPVEVSDESDEWDLLYEPSKNNFDYRRTFKTGYGELIWDLAGNASEIVDFDDHDTNFTEAPGCSPGGISYYDDFTYVSSHCPNLQDHFEPPTTSWGISNGAGSFQAYSGSSIIIRGGQRALNNRSGIYAAWKSIVGATATNADRGFRCVWRPSL